MTDKRKSIYILILRLLTAAAACVGLYFTIFTAKDGFMGASSLCYYTIQSNLWVLLLTVAALIMMLAKIREPRWFGLLRFVIAVAIMVTFLVFWTMLAYTMPPSYLVTPSNLTLHTLVPLLTLFDALFIDPVVPTSKQVLFCTLPPIYYLGFAMIRAEISSAPLAGGSRYPYWFLDVDKLGWFGFENGVGVFYWVLVVVALVLGIGYGLRALKKPLTARREK